MPCLPIRRSGSLVVRAASSTGSSLSQPSRPSGRVSSERILRCLTAGRRRHGIGRVWREFFGCSLGMRARDHAPRAQKIRRPSSGGGKFRGDFSFRRSLSRTSTHLGQGTLPSPTAGCRIRFPESLLMLTLSYAKCRGICTFFFRFAMLKKERKRGYCRQLLQIVAQLIPQNAALLHR